MAYGYTLTAVGRNLLLKLQAGSSMTISRIAVGDGDVPDGVDPTSLTSLINEVERSQATCTKPIVEDDTLSFEIEYRNKWENGTFGENYTDSEGLEESFWLKEYAVFALDEDDNEVMLYYANLGDFPEPVAKWNGRNLVSKRYPVSISIVQDDTDVQLAFPANAFITSEYLEQYVDDRLKNERPTKKIATIVHNLGYYPIVQVLSTVGAYGVGGYGEYPFGGYGTQTIISKQQHNDRNSFDVLVLDDFDLDNPEVTTITEGVEYAITFDNSGLSLVVILSCVDNITVADTNATIDAYNKKEVDELTKTSSFVLNVSGGQTHWNSANDPNTSYSPPEINKWGRIPAKASKLIDANNFKTFGYYADFVDGNEVVSFASDLSEKIRRVKFEIVAFMQNQSWYNSTIRMIAHRADVLESEYFGDALNFSENTILLAQFDFNASNGQRNATISGRTLHTLLRNADTNELIDRNGWIVEFQMLTDNTNDYISDKSYVIITFEH